MSCGGRQLENQLDHRLLRIRCIVGIVQRFVTCPGAVVAATAALFRQSTDKRQGVYSYLLASFFSAESLSRCSCSRWPAAFAAPVP